MEWIFDRVESREQNYVNSATYLFKGGYWGSLAREVIQNSLDAKNSDKPVKVAFRLHTREITTFPQHKRLSNVLDRCLVFLGEDHRSTETVNKGIQVLNCEKISYLEIADYNTEGISGCENVNSGKNNQWAAFIYSIGKSVKSKETSNGSFGVGKHAPYNFSPPLTVFYNTLNSKGHYAFMGVAKLFSWINEENTQRYSSTGYFGYREDNSMKYHHPIKNMKEIDEIFHRKDNGTSVFIPGIDPDEKITVHLIRSIISNFYPSILEKNLVIELNLEKNQVPIIINEKTIIELGKKYLKSDDDYKDSFYNMMVYKYPKYDVDRVIIYNRKNYGTINIKLSFDEEYNPDRNYSIFRGKLMHIRDYPIYVSEYFRAVVTIDDQKAKELNKILVKMENPEHNDFNERFIPNKKDVKECLKVLESLRSTVRKFIKENIIEDNKDSYDVDVFSEFFNFDGDKPQSDNGLKKSKLGKSGVSKKESNLSTKTPIREDEGDEEIEHTNSGKKKKVKKKYIKDLEGNVTGVTKVPDAKVSNILDNNEIYLSISSTINSGVISIDLINEDNKIGVNNPIVSSVRILKGTCNFRIKERSIFFDSLKDTTMKILLNRNMVGYRMLLEVFTFEEEAYED